MYKYFIKMKITLHSVCFFIAVVFSLNVFAQKTLSEGILTYSISIETANGEKKVANALNGATLTLYLNKDKSRTEVVNTLGTEATFFDTKMGKGYLLREYSAQKLMITVNADNWAQKNKVNNNLVFKTDDETVSIGGYTCKKATATTADGKNYTVYFDPSVTLANKTYNNAFPQLQGLPVQYELQSGNLIFKYTLTKNSADAVAINKFETPKTGFRVMTFEENQQLKKGE
jgi:GLPGLI family protein